MHKQMKITKESTFKPIWKNHLAKLEIKLKLKTNKLKLLIKKLQD